MLNSWLAVFFFQHFEYVTSLYFGLQSLFFFFLNLFIFLNFILFLNFTKLY